MTPFLKFFIWTSFAFNALAQPLAAEIYEIRLTIENITCPYCGTSLVQELKGIKGVEDAKIWPMEGIGVVQWKKNSAFHAVQLFRMFYKTQFLLKEIDVDVEGVIREKKGATVLESYPDGSVFYIDNPRDLHLDTFDNFSTRALKEGMQVRLQGMCTSQQGFNFLLVKEALPPVGPDQTNHDQTNTTK